MTDFAKKTSAFLLLMGIISTCGCALGPRQIQHSRMKYNTAIQRTFQEEMLLNLVRLKYREIPEFVTIGGIAAQYTFEGSTSAALTIPEAGLDVLGLGAGLERSERPTISYAPARGKEFQKGILGPIDLESLQLLARTGWRWDRILRTTVQYMNDVDNATAAGGPTPDRKPQFEEFRYLAQLFLALQTQRLVELTNAETDGPSKLVPLPREQLDGDFVINALKEGYNFKETPQGLAVYKERTFPALVFHPRAKSTREMQEVARLLGLAIDFDSPKPQIYEVITSRSGGFIQPAYEHLSQKWHGHATTHVGWHLQEEIPRSPAPQQLPGPRRTELVVSTRSLLEVMFYLSQGVMVPEEHMAQGLVTLTVDEYGQPFDWTEMTGDLLRICSSVHRPPMAAVAIPFRGYWFYIDDADLNSQSTFALLVELFGIEVQAGGGGAGGLLYTLSVGG
jgi:hypothetical protein